MKPYKSKVLFKKASKNAVLHSEGIQSERLLFISESVSDMLRQGGMDFESYVEDPDQMREALESTFGIEIAIALLNDDIAAPWAVGFAQASLIAAKMVQSEYEDE